MRFFQTRYRMAPPDDSSGGAAPAVDDAAAKEAEKKAAELAAQAKKDAEAKGKADAAGAAEKLNAAAAKQLEGVSESTAHALLEELRTYNAGKTTQGDPKAAGAKDKPAEKKRGFFSWDD